LIVSVVLILFQQNDSFSSLHRNHL
jgi:hypothetical protein